MTGNAAGTTSVYVTDAATGATAVLTVIVTQATTPVEHEYVDLGLPSGTLWATTNVGATNPEEYGDYFAWGETEPKDVYDWSTYKWCNGSETTLTKYCTDSYYGTVDNKTELEPEDDAATVNWGSLWRMPSQEQIKELVDNCTWSWTTRNGMNGRLVTGPNGNTLFLPAAGFRSGNSLSQAGSRGTYWSLSLFEMDDDAPLYLHFNSDEYGLYYGSMRITGLTVRPVRVAEAPVPDEDEYTVNGVTFKMITVEGGTFTMGDDESTLSWDGQSPEHQVTLSDYKIGQTQVTQALWQAVMGSNPSYYTEDVTCPVECVSWYDCQEFILRLNQLTGKQFRMLTEAEWEFAARGGNLSHGYKFSGSDTIDIVSWNLYNSGFKTHPVATKLPNELGIYDMTGNVSEWCQDWFGSYSSSAQTNPLGPAEGNTRVLRDNGIAGFGGEGQKKSFSHDDEGMYGGWYVTWRYNWQPEYYGFYDNDYDFLTPLPGLRIALDVDDSSKFRLSESVVTVDVGESASVNILNGGSSYTVAGGTNNVTTTISGNTLTVTGIAAGTTSVYVTDAATGATAALNVIVNPVFSPDEPEYVDLGLPSGTLWATRNVGATNPEDYGDYFAWGETEPKDVYGWSTYEWCNGTERTLTKYCSKSYYGTVDDKTELDPEDDAAYVNMGPSWRMPTKEQQDELKNSCTRVSTTRNGVKGTLFTGPNGNTLFLPAAGSRSENSLNKEGKCDCYWSRTLYSSSPNYAYYLYYDMGSCYTTYSSRSNGYTVRAVRATEAPVLEEEEFTVNGVTFKMITVDGGTFTMGDDSSTDSDVKPAHQVTLSTFKIGQTEVTQALWQAVMGSNPSYFTGDLQRPVEMISWADCQRFVYQLNQLTGKRFRMTTEAEWEFAARGGNYSQGYTYSGSNTLDDVAWIGINNNTPTHAVGQKLPNELSLYDMTGNVTEWCQDLWYRYTSAAQTNPVLGTGFPLQRTGYPVTYRGAYDGDIDGNKECGVGMRLALDGDNSSKFGLSDPIITLAAGAQQAVDVLNGNSSYSVAYNHLSQWPNEDEAVATYQLNGNVMNVTGVAPGITCMIVTDAATGSQTALTIFVTEATTPVEHEYVDLGLPSGTLWATTNVGATNPEDYGDYFAWGETEPKETYDIGNYKWCRNSQTSMTKYCTNSSYGYNGFTDNKTELEPEDDAAYVNWGEDWRMPSYDQLNELKTNCTWSGTTINGVNGLMVTGPNGNSLFLPTAGYRYENSLSTDGSFGLYWSRILGSAHQYDACNLGFSVREQTWLESHRYNGYTVRPIRYTEPAVTAVPVITYDIQDDYAVISATGDGEVLLYIEGNKVEIPYTIARGSTEVTVTVVATAQEAGKDMSSTSMVIVIPAKVSSGPLPTDGQNYNIINGVKIENLWIQDRIHTPTEWTSKPYCNTNARTAVLYNGCIYISRSNVPINENSNQSHVYVVNAQNGQLINDIPLTLNGVVYGNTTLSANNIGVDDFGHLYISPFSNNETRYHPIYFLNETTGELTLVTELDKGSAQLYRCDYIDVIGDLTRQQAECNIMAIASPASSYDHPSLVYRWHADQGGAFGGGFNGTSIMTINEFYPETITQYGQFGPPIVRMRYGENTGMRYSGEQFYLDCSGTAPLLYNLNGDLLDSFKDTPSDCQPMDVAANGVCQFELEGRTFLVYAAAQFTGLDDATGANRGCQVYICELADDDKPLSNMQFYWMVPDALGYMSDGGTRIQSINVEYGTDVSGKPEVTLFIYKNYNGMGVYKITLDDSYTPEPSDLSTGEWAYQHDGVSPALVGQTTEDHLFVRMDSNDTSKDNTLNVNSSSPQLVWFWLNDDEIYENNDVQALTPCAYNSNGDLYNEITYNSFQCDLYLPTNLELVNVNDVYSVKGDRMPSASYLQWAQYPDGTVIDGVNYNRYLVTCYNLNSYGSHFSGRNATSYDTYGALKTDDGALFGLYIRNKDLSISASQLSDIIIANTEYSMRETLLAGWNVNQYRFFYGTGGNNVTQRFQKYVRVKLRYN